MTTRIDRLFIGGITPLPPEGHPTGIFKHAVDGAVRLGPEGLAGDAQADRRVHGGPHKALHQYAAEHYALLRAAFPDRAEQFVPGSLGENVSATGWTEETVCIGDVFRIGAATVQVSQPRQPCWKIDHKFGLDALMRFVAERGIAGWYYRVREGGMVAAGDSFELLERNAEPVSLRELWFGYREHRPDPARLARLREAPGLSPNWVKKLDERIDWLRRHDRPE